ncbi:MAG: hypothetical protein KIH67_000835 [Candidatus Moranbacteria bacterium]|nr:hypothetical protein [Candidatus Moranbacteria bacterium]
MIKSLTALALTALAAFAASAAEAKPTDCRARDVRIECYLETPHQSAVSPNQAQTGDQQTVTTTRTPEAGGFREPNASPEQVLQATSFSQAAFRQCMQEVRRDESRRAWNEAGQQVGIMVVDRLTRSNSYGGGYYGGNYRYNNGGNQSLQSCEQVRDTVYADMLRATPAAYCDRVMTSTRRRDGTLVNGGNVDERCQSRSAEPFDAGMRYPGN